MRLTKREARARMQLIQEAHLDKCGQRCIDAIHHDVGTSYRDLRALYHAGIAFGQALETIVIGIGALGQAATKAARIVGEYVARGGRLRVDSMTATPTDVYIKATIMPNIPPMEINVQVLKEAAP